MASINLLPRKEFEITLDDGSVIKGQYGTWPLRRLTDKYNIGLGEEKTGSIGMALDYILFAVENSARKVGAPFSFTDVHVGDWMDQLGGVESESVQKLANHANADYYSNPNEEKKRTLSP